MKRKIQFVLLLAICSLFTACGENQTGIEKEFAEAKKQPWTIVFEDDFMDGYEDKWVLDGAEGYVSYGSQGMELYSGEEAGNDAAHLVLWTRESFSGPLKIEYDFTRLDDSDTESVCIIYFHATGSGTEPYSKDLMQWNELRDTAAMRVYFNHMNAYHISYAVTSPATEGGDYVRARRYVPETGKGLDGTALMPEYDHLNWFKKDVTYKMTVILYEGKMYLQAVNGKEKRLFWFDTSTLPPLDEGYVGLRQMWTRASRYANFKVSTLD